MRVRSSVRVFARRDSPSARITLHDSKCDIRPLTVFRDICLSVGCSQNKRCIPRVRRRQPVAGVMLLLLRRVSYRVESGRGARDRNRKCLGGKRRGEPAARPVVDTPADWPRGHFGSGPVGSGLHREVCKHIIVVGSCHCYGIVVPRKGFSGDAALASLPEKRRPRDVPDQFPVIPDLMCDARIGKVKFWGEGLCLFIIKKRASQSFFIRCYDVWGYAPSSDRPIHLCSHQKMY